MKLNDIAVMRLVVFVMFFFLGVRAESYASESEGHESKEYLECIGSAQLTHPEMIGCTQAEIEKHENHIRSAIERNAADDSLGGLIESIGKSSSYFNVYINELCDAYQMLEGQRGEVLRVNCLLKEVIRREVFVREIINEAKI